jgi:hypothetical protein
MRPWRLIHPVVAGGRFDSIASVASMCIGAAFFFEMGMNPGFCIMAMHTAFY